MFGYLPAVVMGVGVSLWIALVNDPAGSLAQAVRVSTYQTFAEASGAMFGFALMAFSVLFAVAPKSRLAAVVAYSNNLVRGFLTGCLAVLATCTVGFAVLLPLDGGQHAHPVAECFAFFLIDLLVTTIVQLVWLTSRLFNLLGAEVHTEAEASLPTSWQPPAKLDPTAYNVPTEGQFGRRSS